MLEGTFKKFQRGAEMTTGKEKTLFKLISESLFFILKINSITQAKKMRPISKIKLWVLPQILCCLAYQHHFQQPVTSEVSSASVLPNFDKPDLSGDTPNTVDSHFGYINNIGNPPVSYLSWVPPWVLIQLNSNLRH